MAESKFLTTEEVSERYRGQISVGTLRNWRAQPIGPPYIKIGKSVLYPVQGLDEWDNKNDRLLKIMHQSSGAASIRKKQRL
ncbi:MAG: DNA-binding protein [Rhodospirillales bacterium 69-11]|nr:MAG: DNA-binding protein [Rhodospirillales bacterium 69-11]